MKNYRDLLITEAAAKLAASHGRFFAAAMMADLGVPLEVALCVLAGRTASTRDLSLHVLPLKTDNRSHDDGCHVSIDGKEWTQEACVLPILSDARDR